jgi:hypothetical protein
MIDKKHQELDMNELSELTPFSLDVYKTYAKRTSGNIIDYSRVLESAKPLQPDKSQVDNTLISEEASGSES